MWGAVNVSMTALAHVDGRRVVLVLSDGKDTAVGRGRPAVTLGAVIERSQTEDFMVYAIGLASRTVTPGYGGGGYWSKTYGSGQLPAALGLGSAPASLFSVAALLEVAGRF